MYYKLILFALLPLLLVGCISSNTFEKNESIFNHRWDKKEKKTFEFSISDTTSKYLMFMTLRHTDAYHFSNIWVMLETVKPDGKKVKQKVELPLAESSGRWTGKGMNEIYEHKIRLSGESNTRFDQKGIYKVSVTQIMRENPLEEIMSVGFRLERIPNSH